MTRNYPLMLSTNPAWHCHNEEYGYIYPTDICPAEAIKEWNDHRLSICLPGQLNLETFPDDFPDPYITPELFVAMRKRIGYSDELIKKELRIVYGQEELTNYLLS